MCVFNQRTFFDHAAFLFFLHALQQITFFAVLIMFITHAFKGKNSEYYF